MTPEREQTVHPSGVGQGQTQDRRPPLESTPGVPIDGVANAAAVAVAVQERQPAPRERLCRRKLGAKREEAWREPQGKRETPEGDPAPRELACTAEGKKAVREWVGQIRPTHLLLDDPLRTKVQSFGLLSREEQIAWIVEVKERLHDKLAELEAYKKEVEAPFKDFLHDNAVSSVRARMDWLDRMLFGIMHGRES